MGFGLRDITPVMGLGATKNGQSNGKERDEMEAGFVQRCIGMITNIIPFFDRIPCKHVFCGDPKTGAFAFRI